MPARTAYKSGMPCWADLSSADLIGSVDFYQRLFGWRAEFDPRPEMGGYGHFRQRDKIVAGIGPTFGEGTPSVWNTYFATDDAESVTDRVKEAGGSVSIGPVQVFDEGCTAVFQDPAGATFMVWQPGRHYGAQLVDEPVALCWVRLESGDPLQARAFYPAVFGWAERSQAGGTDWLVDGRAVAGILPAAASSHEGLPAATGPSEEAGPAFTGRSPEALVDVAGPSGQILAAREGSLRRPPARWLVFFAVSDCDATAAVAGELGGRVLRRPADLPAGRHAVLADPHGAAFGVATPSRPG